MTELKKLILDSFQSGGLSHNILKKHQTLFSDIDTPMSFEDEATPPSNLPLVLESLNPNRNDDRNEEDFQEDYEENAIEDIAHEEDDASLSIEKKEKELIIKALKRHNNKRKYAAQDLGISERTLYRKIKHYDINE